MDSTSSGQIRERGRNKRVWTPNKDEKLVECLVELCVSGKVKCDNGFKPRAFLQVEKMLEEKLPNNGLKVSPHIELCVKTLKKQFNAIMDMLTHGSGFSWDNAKKMVLCDQDVFEGWVKVNIFTIFPILYFYSTTSWHKYANGLRLKPLPHFDDLSLVFGKDRANGKGAMSAANILEESNQGEASNDIEVDDLEAEADASRTNTVASTPRRMECSSQSRRKRAKNDDTTLINVMTRTCNALESLVGNFNKQTERENRVVSELEKLPNLNRLDILKLIKLLFNLDEDLKVEWVKQILQTP
ncbi:hypothetical protein PVL29_012264 [Vitis rotundifolia]|uniref:Myb/SANT-like domain-containing protein n=1 Tax=Vitis rotundifolia TaxID=103349 RepID=A0AA39DQH6_VITRO|nr:hypothetical protein PVL29_012264 [Vitis rotundifolia]